MGDRVRAFAFITAGDLQLDLGQLRKRCVIGVGAVGVVYQFDFSQSSVSALLESQ